MLSFLLNILIIMAIYSIVAISLNIHYGYVKLPNFGIAGFFAIGAYSSAILTAPHRLQEMAGFAGTKHIIGLFAFPFPVGLLAAVILAGLGAFLVGVPLLRLRGDYLAVASIGVAEIIRMVAVNELWLTNGSAGIRLIPMPTGNRIIYLFIVLALLALCYWAANRLFRSPFGRIWKGIREDETVTSSLGKKIFRGKMWGWVLGAGMAGLGGSLWAHYAMAIQPTEFVPEMTFLVWIAVLIGGLGNNTGVLLGTALVIGVFQQGTRFLPSFGAPWIIPALRLIIIGLAFIVALRVRPQGAVPEGIRPVEKHLKLRAPRADKSRKEES